MTEVNSERHEYIADPGDSEGCIKFLGTTEDRKAVRVCGQPREAQVHAVESPQPYEPDCYYCRNGYCHDHSKGAGKFPPDPADSLAQPVAEAGKVCPDCPHENEPTYKICNNCWLAIPWREGREFTHKPYPYACGEHNEILVVRADTAAPKVEDAPSVESALAEIHKLLPQHLVEIKTLAKSGGWRRVVIQLQGQPAAVAETLAEALQKIREYATKGEQSK